MKIDKKYINKIFLGDNIDLFKNIPNKSIDMIFADPPYNMNLKKDLFRFDGTKFDGVTDDWDKYSSFDEYDSECFKWINECLRVLKDNGSFWVIGSFQNIHRIGYILQNLGAWIINEIVWEKSNPVPNFAGTRFVNAQETLLWVVKNEKSKFTFNYKTMKFINNGTQMKSIWRFSTCNGSERLKDENGKKIHSTQKPLELLKRIIIACSKPNDIILDPFSGTGTTAHAAKMLGRNFIGFEKNEKYYYSSLERIRSVKEDFDNVDIKNAIYDIKPIKVSFLDLLMSKYISIYDNISIKNCETIFHFNNNGMLEFNGQKYTPNSLCKLLFNKPTNAWNVINVNGNPISDIRDKYRKEKNKN